MNKTEKEKIIIQIKTIRSLLKPDINYQKFLFLKQKLSEIETKLGINYLNNHKVKFAKLR